MTVRMGHPLFMSGGHLGLPGEQVLNALDPVEGTTARNLSLMTGINVGSVRRVLIKLHEINGAIKGTDGCWYLSPGFDPDQAARDLGLESRMAKRDERLDKEAALHRDAIAQARKAHQRSDNNTSCEGAA